MQSRLPTQSQVETEYQRAALYAAQARANAFPTAMGSLMNLWTMLFVAAGFALAIALSLLDNSQAKEQAQYEDAIKLWLSDCTKSVDQCAADWDKGYTLRKIYERKVGG